MKLGIIARVDDRGLGNQTWEAVRHLNPDRVLVVREPGSEAQGFEPHLERFPGALVVTDEVGRLPERPVREWLDGLDVVYSAETLYDVRLAGWARLHGVATVIHANPEFFRDRMHDPTVWWSATDWRLEHLPRGTRVVPMPCPLDRWPQPNQENPRRVLHVAGRIAVGDRNGTKIVLAASHLLEDIEVVIACQGDLPDSPATKIPAAANYWELYQEAPILVMPRRYGGLCLPVIEACGAGLVPIMTDTEPNRTWPIVAVPSWQARRPTTVPAGKIFGQECSAEQLAATITETFDDLPAKRERSRRWAVDHSWAELTDVWFEALGEAADRAIKPKARRHGDVETIVPWMDGCEDRQRAWDWVWPKLNSPTVAELRPGPWSKGQAINPVIESSTADIIVVHDADVWCDISHAVERVRFHGGWAVPHTHVFRLNERGTKRLLETGDVDDAITDLEQPRYRGQICGGIVVMARELALDVPLDPRFVGWGGEDFAWSQALHTLFGEPWQGEERLIHLWHPPQERPSRGRGSAATEQLRRKYKLARGDAVRMRGLIDQIREVTYGVRECG